MKIASFAAVLALVVAADPSTGTDTSSIRGVSNEQDSVDLLTTYPDAASKLEAGIQKFYKRATTTDRKDALRYLLRRTSATSATSAGEDGRGLLSDACVSRTDAIYDEIDVEVTALFGEGGGCGPKVSFVPSIVASIDHNDCSEDALKNHTEACLASTGTTILVNLNAECKIHGMIPFIPITA